MGDELYRLALVCLLGGVVLSSAIFLASTVVGSMADKRREARRMNVLLLESRAPQPVAQPQTKAETE